ncbi:accessory Sec system protein Asp1 [Staphylococcus delphini]|uniref:accessory Sec system protein Asp1 n=1 Tax=Staphylococcus delphini TaxID=53344 RepID=UPI000BBC72DA|nr:accessory Sec system protein Asp1 [Staphylococcus delphini]PCF72654.1 accessory Sec system protein Asp1 [Staphylococcus delphini]
MKYFVPAWYDDDNGWCQLTQPFYVHSRKVQFDDAISLMSMHAQNDVEFKLLHLNYQPHLRLFLHKYDLYETAIWSLFDEIQGFDDALSRSFQFEDLEWPDDAEFVFSPYLIQVLTENGISKVYFNQDGYLIWLDDDEQYQQQRRYIFDERGYLSAIRYYENGEVCRQDYLTATGEVILRENKMTQQVEVMAPFQGEFNAPVYDSMDMLIQERFARYCARHLTEADQLIVSVHPQHQTLFWNVATRVPVCYSIFTKRNQTLNEAFIQSIGHSSKWLVDTSENEARLKALLVNHAQPPEILKMTPFDTQQLTNVSSQLHETYIGIWIEGMRDADLQQALQQLTTYIQREPSYRLVLLTQKDVAHVESWIRQWIHDINAQHNDKAVKDKAKAELIEAKAPTQIEEVVQLQSVPYEEDVLKVLTRLRIIIDLSEEPDLYVQIASVSVRIPQIHMFQSHYVTDFKNGIIIDHYEALHAALDYFLKTLKHWNAAYTFNTNRIETLRSKRMIAQLDQFLEGDNDGATV